MSRATTAPRRSLGRLPRPFLNNSEVAARVAEVAGAKEVVTDLIAGAIAEWAGVEPDEGQRWSSVNSELRGFARWYLGKG